MKKNYSIEVNPDQHPSVSNNKIVSQKVLMDMYRNGAGR